jgi:hypothetical protein
MRMWHWRHKDGQEMKKKSGGGWSYSTCPAVIRYARYSPSFSTIFQLFDHFPNVLTIPTMSATLWDTSGSSLPLTAKMITCRWVCSSHDVG